jgi:ubiquinone/menaquinone biosynthesis C-methylase UbiE
MTSNYTPELVRTVNEVYHDVEGALYNHKHPEIMVDEVQLWKQLLSRFLPDGSEIRILDVGSGTGFVPLLLAERLGSTAFVICSDISSVMLDVCRTRMLTSGAKCKQAFVKIDGDGFPFEDRSFDMVTMNSVLHHQPLPGTFLNDIGRLLRHNGLLIIVHEPNRAFFQNSVLLWNYRLINRLSRIIGRRFKSGDDRESEQHVVDEINLRLMQASVFPRPLTLAEIVSITDIQSPTAGGFFQDRGLDPLQLIRDNLGHFTIELYRTYNHCHRHSRRGLFLRTYSMLLGKIFPYAGAQFCVVLRKLH